MLLGLFFVTTGASLDVQLLIHNWTIVVALLGGLLAVKVGIIGSASQLFGLSKSAISLSPPPLLPFRFHPANAVQGGGGGG